MVFIFNNITLHGAPPVIIETWLVEADNVIEGRLKLQTQFMEKGAIVSSVGPDVGTAVLTPPKKHASTSTKVKE